MTSLNQIINEAHCRQCNGRVTSLGEPVGFPDKVLISCAKCDYTVPLDKKSITEHYILETQPI